MAKLKDAPARDALIQVRDTRDWGIRSEAARALGAFTPDEVTLAALATSLQDAQNQVVEQTLESLTRLGSQAASLSNAVSDLATGASSSWIRGAALQTLAAIDPGPPLSANGIARRLAGIGDSTDPADQLDGLTYLDFHSSLSAKIGRKIADSHEGVERHSQLLVQANSLRAQISGVSLDEEAAYLVQLQRSYQATAKLVGVVDELTQTLISMLN